MVQKFQDGNIARAKDIGKTSEPFSVSNGERQGCVLAPALFSLMFSAVLTDVFLQMTIYRTYGKLLNVRRLQAKTKVMKDIIRDFLFDCALNAGSEADVQCRVDKCSAVCPYFSLTISTKKTEVLPQPAPGSVNVWNRGGISLLTS